MFVSIVTPFKKKSVLLGLLSFNGGRLVVGLLSFTFVFPLDIMNPNGSVMPVKLAPLRLI